MAASCFGYVTDWNFIAFLVILMSLLGIALLYALSNFLPASTRAKIRGLVRTEITQIILSGLIIVLLISATSVACDVTQNTDPFSFATNYVGELITGPPGNGFMGGIQLITGLFSYSFAYSIVSGIWQGAGDLVSSYLTGGGSGINTPVFSIAPAPGLDLGIPYGALSTLYIDFFFPFALVGISLMFVQYLVLVISQAAAFSIVLPIGLIMRSFAFAGQGLRNAANAVIAIAIALYIIYPLTVAFDAYSITWIYTQCTGGLQPPACNPSANFLTFATDLNVNRFLSQDTIGTGCISTGSYAGNFCSMSPSSAFSFFSGEFSTILPLIYPGNAIAGAENITVALAEYLFAAIFMLGINLAIVLAFASGLTHALDYGIEGAASFWSSL